ncbi:MAG TPA: PepSY-like domain-containing protein [Bacteroidales bacterium]|nr:PepSY-like domain-containing protein [Bacteroidales bacterium]HPS15683.1 PepSY-like domain-containing protein [Bacteroidales bacterium]
MKRLIVLSAALMLSTLSFSQKIIKSDVPESINKAFVMKFPNATNENWEKKDTLYEISFMIEQSATEAVFNDKGTWMETEWEIPMIYTPKAMKNYLDTAYAGYKINEIEIMEYPNDGKLYKAEISKKKDCKNVYFSLKSEFKKVETAVCEKKKKCKKQKTPVDPKL